MVLFQFSEQVFGLSIEFSLHVMSTQMVLDFFHVKAASKILVLKFSFSVLRHGGLILGFEGFVIEAFEEFLNTDEGLELFHGAEHFLKFLVLGHGLDFESFLHVMVILIELVSLMLWFFG